MQGGCREGEVHVVFRIEILIFVASVFDLVFCWLLLVCMCLLARVGAVFIFTVVVCCCHLPWLLLFSVSAIVCCAPEEIAKKVSKDVIFSALQIANVPSLTSLL